MDGASDISESTESVIYAVKKEREIEEVSAIDTEAKTLKLVHRTRSGAAKLDAALQALNDYPASHRGVNHKPPHVDEEPTSKREARRNSSRNSNTGRTSEESTRSNGRRSGEGRRSLDGSSNRKSNESQRSTAAEPPQQDSSSADQLSQITDILLARLITTLSDSTLGNPALLLQTLLGFSPDDYNDLLAALSESRLSYVDIISAYLHNIRVMSEDSGSTSAALSGTLTRSLIEQYNSLLAQAVKSPQSIARAALAGDTDGRSHLADLLHKANGTDGKPERRSFESLLPKGPSGLGFGRRHSGETSKQRQQTMIPAEVKPTTQSMTDTNMLDVTKLFGNVPKLPVPNMSAMGSMGMQPQGTAVTGGITQEQLAALLQNAGMLQSGANPYVQQQPQQQQQPNPPSLPFMPSAPSGMSGMLTLNMNHPYVHQMQPFAVPMQQQMAGAASNRAGMGWQGATTVGFQHPGNLFRGWGGAGLETVHENFNAHLHHQPQPDPTCFAQAINMQQQHGQP